MTRQLINCLILMLLFQGVTQVSADVLPESQMQHHCGGHKMSAEECACCSDMLAMNGGCASFCSVGIAITLPSMYFPRVSDGQHQRLVVQRISGPTYLPLNPPPIS